MGTSEQSNTKLFISMTKKIRAGSKMRLDNHRPYEWKANAQHKKKHYAIGRARQIDVYICMKICLSLLKHCKHPMHQRLLNLVRVEISLVFVAMDTFVYHTENNMTTSSESLWHAWIQNLQGRFWLKRRQKNAAGILKMPATFSFLQNLLKTCSRPAESGFVYWQTTAHN